MVTTAGPYHVARQRRVSRAGADAALSASAHVTGSYTQGNAAKQVLRTPCCNRISKITAVWRFPLAGNHDVLAATGGGESRFQHGISWQFVV